MATPEPTATSPTTGESSSSPPPTATSEINAVPAGDASKEKTKSKVPGGSESPTPPEKTGSKPGSKPSRRTPSMARTMAPDKGEQVKEPVGGGNEEKDGSDAESEYETICIRRKKPTPFLQRLKKFLAAYLAFDMYMASVMWEAFKLVIFTSQFNWALEIMAGFIHIMVAAGRCAIKKQCTAHGRTSDSPDSDKEKTPDWEKKSPSMKQSNAGKTSKGGASPSIGKSQSKVGPTGSAENTAPTATESGEGKTSTAPSGETSDTGKTPEPTSTSAAAPTSSA